MQPDVEERAQVITELVSIARSQPQGMRSYGERICSALESLHTAGQKQVLPCGLERDARKLGGLTHHLMVETSAIAREGHAMALSGQRYRP